MSVVTLTMAATAGCGTGLLDQNQGGDTPCGDYLEMTADDQRDVILTYLDEQGNSNPAGFEVTLTLQSAKLYCNTMGTSSDPIRRIETG
jgi:acid stress chaperone HdeA